MTWTPPPKVDLRNCTRGVSHARTIISIEGDDCSRHTWLILGEVQIRPPKDGCSGAVKGRLTEGVTDFEHDSAYAFSIPIVGFTMVGEVEYSRVSFLAHVAATPYDQEDLRVPLGPYDPAQLPGATVCKDCEGETHIIVPTGHFSGPPAHGDAHADLWKKVRGRLIEIRMLEPEKDPK